jgi:hypothetical protein
VSRQTRILKIEHEPWLLGWCRWDIVLETEGAGALVWMEILASGRWRWRGRGAPYRESVFVIDSVEDARETA